LIQRELARAFSFLNGGNETAQMTVSRLAFLESEYMIMQNPVIISVIVFAVILLGALVGCAIRECLPKHQLSDETKSTVSVSMAVVATFSALVLGLLISNANTSFSALGRGDHPLGTNPSA
jgi:uncharacterized membrane protein YraQ (UPF0718 family)